jgi:superfamily II DNA or RNA helicase
MMMADTFSTIFTCTAYKLILCLTGTIDRLDGKQSLLSEYAPICDTITLAEAIQNEWVADFKQYKVLLDVDLTEYQTQHTRFLHHFSYFNFDFGTAMACVTDYQYRIAYAGRIGDTVKNVMIHAMGFNRAMRARKDFIYNHSKKIEITDRIIAHRTGKKIITFTKSVEHAKQISTGEVYHGSLAKKKKERVMQEFNDADNGVLNSCKALDVGADVKGVNTIIILSGDSSSITKRQRIGRGVRREGDKVAEIWHLVIRGTVEEEWFRKSSQGLEFIAIDEEQFNSLLITGEHSKKKHKENIHTFRF